MGCNSHLAIEIKGRWSHSPEEWDTWALDIPESRNYSLYEAMAGVRGEESNAVVPVRGVPKDCDPVTAHWIKRAGADGHTHSWLTPVEFHKAIERVTADDNKTWNAVDGVLTTLQMLYGDENVRLVFFFDN